MAGWLNGSRRLVRRILPLTMGGVVAIFLVSTAYTELLLNDEVDALDIASNSAPSVAYLSDARGELREIARAGERGSRVDHPGVVAEARAAYVARRHDLDVMLAAYSQMANYVGEPELYDVAKAKLAAVDEALRAGAVAPNKERATATGRFDDAVGQLDGALQALSELNGAHLQSAAASLARMGRRRNRWVFLLDGFAILAALGATLLAARTVERYLATLARRARELEHLAIEVGHGDRHAARAHRARPRHRRGLGRRAEARRHGARAAQRAAHQEQPRAAHHLRRRRPPAGAALAAHAAGARARDNRARGRPRRRC